MDCLIAAVCPRVHAELYHNDRDFEAIAGSNRRASRRNNRAGSGAAFQAHRIVRLFRSRSRGIDRRHWAGYESCVLSSGHAAADRRNLHLHRVALAKLADHPELRHQCLALVDRWLNEHERHPAEEWLRRWRTMLADWPLDRIAETVLDEEAGQPLRQCSPLGPALSPRERWAALEEVNATIELEARQTIE